MISWIQKYFQKHFRLVFALILIAVAVPMVVVYNESSGSLGRRERGAGSRAFFHLDLNNEEQVRRAVLDARYSAELKGIPIYDPSQVQQYAYVRVTGIAVANELGLPLPTDADLSRYTGDLNLFKNAEGKFDQQRYAAFGDSLKGNPGGVTTADINRILRDDARLEALQKVLGGPGYVQPDEVAKELHRWDSTWTVAVASVDYAAYDPGLAITDAAVQQFYNENTFRYTVPPRLRVSALEFKGNEFIPSVPPTDAEMRAFYDANPARFPAPAETEKKDAAPSLTLGATPPAANPADAYEKVKDKVLAALMQERALKSALEFSNQITIALSERKPKANSPELAALLASVRRPLAEWEPFASSQPPQDKPWLYSASRELNQLNADRHFSDPIRTPDGFAILFWRETLPTYTPGLAEVKDKAAADYRDSEKRKRFIEHGKALRAKLEAAVKSGTPFEKAAADAKLELKAHAGFKFSQPPQDLSYSIITSLENLAPGQVGEMVADDKKGHLAFVVSRLLPDTTAANPRFNEIKSSLANQASANRALEYLGKRMQDEFKKTAPAKDAPAS
jgi:peptidyl-prolyl cis-trans isomerase D